MVLPSSPRDVMRLRGFGFSADAWCSCTDAVRFLTQTSRAAAQCQQRFAIRLRRLPKVSAAFPNVVTNDFIKIMLPTPAEPTAECIGISTGGADLQIGIFRFTCQEVRNAC